jgi:hypothetical protein
MSRARLLSIVLATATTVLAAAAAPVSSAPWGPGASPVCGKKKEGRAEIHFYCGPARATFTVDGKTHRAVGGKCFNDTDHSGNPRNWYLFAGKQTINDTIDGPKPKYPFIHVWSALRKPGTYAPPKQGVVLVSLQIPGLTVGTLENKVTTYPQGLGTVRETAAVTLSSFSGLGPIPQRGSFKATKMFAEPAQVLATGSFPPLTKISGSWRC